METPPQMKCIRKCLLGFFALAVLLSCAKTPQEQVPKSHFPSTGQGDQKSIRLHMLYAMPRGELLGPGIRLGVAEGLDTEKVRKSIVQVVDSEGDARTGGSGFFVAPDKIATAIHVVTGADLDSLHVKSGDTHYTIQEVTAYDAKIDLVVLRVSDEGVPLVLVDSQAVRSGDTVFFVGYFMDRYNVMEK